MFLLSVLFRVNVLLRDENSFAPIITSEALNYHYPFLQHALEYLHLLHSCSFNENNNYTKKNNKGKKYIYTICRID